MEETRILVCISVRIFIILCKAYNLHDAFLQKFSIWHSNCWWLFLRGLLYFEKLYKCPQFCICIGNMFLETCYIRSVRIFVISDCNWAQTHNNLVRKRRLNHLAKLAKWLSCVVSTYLYGEFNCMFLSCHVRIAEWIHALYLSECQGTTCSKQEENLKFKWVRV